MKTNIDYINEIQLNGVEFKNIEFEYYYHKNSFNCKTLFILHALTGDASIYEYWNNFVGPSKIFDTDKFNIVCITTLGTTKGSFGPNSTYNNVKMANNFPEVSLDDLANFQVAALNKLGIDEVDVLIGTSLGGMVGWNIANNYPNFAKKIMLIGSLDRVGVEMFVQNNIALDVLELDQSESKLHALSICRKLGMLQYQTFSKNYSRFDAKNYQSYLDYQGEKFIKRFDWISYKTLLNAINSTQNEEYLSKIKIKKDTPIAILAIIEDKTFYIEEERSLANKLVNLGYDVNYIEVSDHSGHDAFLINDEKFRETICEFLGE